VSVKSGKSEGTVEVTPSGIPVYFQSKPKRLYRIGPTVKPEDGVTDEALLASAQSDDFWREVPSVTTVLDVLAKDALTWWGMQIGAEGVAKLHNLGMVKSTVQTGSQQPVLICPFVRKEKGKGGKTVRTIEWDRWVVAGKEQLIDLLTVQQLTTNHVKSEAGDRGQSVHDAFELWSKEGILPELEMFPPTERGYVEGLLAFLRDVPSAEPEGCEILVASSEHGFAGRYDLRLRTHETHNVVVHRTPVKGSQYRSLAPSRLLTDLKTSKGVYTNHPKQLEGYEIASIESGYEPTDARGILNVSAEGEYVFVRSWARPEDFLSTLNEWRCQQEMNARRKELGILV
jgi:hypothetical protein